MRLLVVLSLVALTVSAPRPRANYRTSDIQLLRYDNDNIDTFVGLLALQNLIKALFKNGCNTVLRNQAKKGFYSWITPSVVTYHVTYTADEDGYEIAEEEDGQPEIAEEEEGPGFSDALVAASMIG